MEPAQPLPLCTAPFTAALIDTDKRVRPCCTLNGSGPGDGPIYFGSIREQRLSRIQQTPGWKQLRQDHRDHRWHDGCIGCREREQQASWSLRQLFLPGSQSLSGQDGTFFSPRWNKGLTYLEMNSSNLCNLACLHCSGIFSTKWRRYEKQMVQDGVRFKNLAVHESSLPDKDLVATAMEDLDLSQLEFLNLKGGEPFLNDDILYLLETLVAQGRLQQVKVIASTNGSIIDTHLRDLLAQAREVVLNLSVDGMGALQEYIRFGNHGIKEVEAFIDFYSTAPSVSFGISTSVMVLNILHLEDIHTWWLDMTARHPDTTFHPQVMNLIVNSPPYLAPGILEQDRRQERSAYYCSPNHDRSVFAPVIQCLEMPTPEAEHMRGACRAYIRYMDGLRNTSLRAISPETADLLELSDV